ncbi:glutathione S-transferase family protein [Pelagibacterium limicola]|uniref:glutathione S-transferase family protein n=1 Tax=Pelagibacterium limicola TaxID=2791022 RepID=UPI0018AFF14D|nr:glutathione S-transferase family protein [Pelagibacterium limicola]
MLTVWGRKSSSNVQAVMWAIGEMALPYERHDVGHIYGGNDTPEFLAMNPNGLVPVISDNGADPIWEAGAILRYLANRYGHETFWPSDPQACAQIDKWAEWAKINVTPAFTGPIFWQLVRTAPSKQDPQAVTAALVKLDKLLDIAEVQLNTHPFLAGETFTLADIQFGHILYRYFDMPIPFPERPGLERYYGALTGRPAYREHVMVSYEELRVTD